MEITFTKTRSELQRERLRFAIFVAVAFHAMVVFGIGFNVLKAKPSTQTIEVTLAVHPSEKEPDEASFIAQASQQGSGNTDVPDELTTDIAADNTSEDIYQQHQVTQSQATPEERRQVIATIDQASQAVVNRNPEQSPQETPATGNETSAPRNLESLKARLDRQRNQYSKIPRTRRLTSVSAKSVAEAAYLLYWVERAERIGNENYPEEARRKRLYGELQLAVTLKPDGSVAGIEVMKSSGHRVLDLAAMRTVRLAAPFAPFNESMREYDRYEIIRTWRYESDDNLTTAGK